MGQLMIDLDNWTQALVNKFTKPKATPEQVEAWRRRQQRTNTESQKYWAEQRAQKANPKSLNYWADQQDYQPAKSRNVTQYPKTIIQPPKTTRKGVRLIMHFSVYDTRRHLYGGI